ncbi:MAG TPA: VOC family protein [Lacunisphaera sp.]|nr:VOC family protein [Lacunisphaera sp.]
MKIIEIAFTGYAVTDMKRAKVFYEGFLGLTKSRGFGQHDGEEQWVEYDIGSGCLALISGAGDQWPPHPAGTAAALEVDDFDGFVAKARAAKVKFVWEPRESPMCRMVVLADPDENWIVLHQRKPVSAGATGKAAGVQG